MERTSRRSAATQSARGDSSDTSSTSLRHRRRRDTSALAARATSNTSASQSDDGADTDSSSVASKKLLPPRGAKKRGAQRDENPAASDRGADDADGDDEVDEEEDEHSGVESRNAAAASSANGKRERSMSNVSTTSSSSSVASDHDEDDREALHVEKLKELEVKKKMVEDGTLAEFCRRVAEFKEERNKLLETAEWHKDLQLKNSQDLYGFEVQRAQNLWQQGKDALKSDLLQQVDALVLKLKQELTDLSNADADEGAATGAKDSVPSSSSPPSDSTEQEDTVSEQEEKIRTKAPIAPKRRKVGEFNFQETTVRLPLDSIHSDLASILDERARHAEIATAKQNKKSTANVRCERRRLFCGTYIFEDGDEVIVSSPVLHEDYIGTISSVTEDAVYIKLSSGQKVRVYLDLIEHKRCEVKPFLRGSAGVGALQATGWSECEPF